MPGFRGAKLVLAAAISLFAAAGIYTTVVILERQDTLNDSSRYTVSWSVSQAANELGRFMHRIVAFSHGSDQATAYEVRLRFEILINRAGILSRGEKTAAFITADTARQDVVRSFLEVLRALETEIVDVAEPTQFAHVISSLQPFEARLVRLASDAYRFDSVMEAEERQELLRLHWLFSSLSGGLILSGLALIALLLWQNRVIGRARDNLQRMADDLGSTTVSRQHLDDIVNGMSEGLLVLAPDGTIEKVNRAACSLVRRAPQHLIDAPIGTVVPALAAAGSVSGPELMRRLREAGEIAAADGTRFPARISVASVAGDGEATSRLICVFADLTNQRRADAERADLREQLYEAQKMQAIGTLAGGIAHDFNNILGSILGYGFLALEETPAGHPSREQLDQIMRAGNRAKDLVHQILTYSRNAAPTLEAVAVGSIVAESMAAIRPTLPASIAFLRGRWEEANVMADPGDLHRVLLNLCVNAGHAIGERSGTITVEVETAMTEGNPTSGVHSFKGAALRPDEKPSSAGASRTRLWFGKLERGRYCRITVADTGCGMDRATMTRIFEPFFTTKEVGKGTGLGLAAVHGIMRNLGGVIAVESEPGHGSRFDIYLPLTEAGRATTDEVASPAPTELAGGERVLLVDDDTALLEMSRQTLTRLGYRVDAFARAEAGLAAFRAAPGDYAAVLTERNMPEVDGERLAAELLRLRADLPIVMMTGYGDADDERRVRALGVREMLFKPVVGAALAAALRRALGAQAAPRRVA